jgi:hypothetical protein
VWYLLHFFLEAVTEYRNWRSFCKVREFKPPELLLLLLSVFVFASFLPSLPLAPPGLLLCPLLDEDHLEVPLRQIKMRHSQRGITYKATKYSLGLM